MIGPTNCKAEWPGLIFGTIQLARMIAHVVVEVDGRDDFADGRHQLLVQHVLDVIHAVRNRYRNQKSEIGNRKENEIEALPRLSCLR